MEHTHEEFYSCKWLPVSHLVHVMLSSQFKQPTMAEEHNGQLLVSLYLPY